jgi:hypothetical protein
MELCPFLYLHFYSDIVPEDDTNDQLNTHLVFNYIVRFQSNLVHVYTIHISSLVNFKVSEYFLGLIGVLLLYKA